MEAYVNERLLAFVFFFIALALSACSSIPTTQKTATPSSAGALVGTEWVLVGLRGEKPLPGSEITLTFQEKEVAGSSGCNTYGGSYLSDNASALAFGDLFMTEMACLDQSIMTQESNYLSALRESAGFIRQANQLEITNVSGETILTFTHK